MEELVKYIACSLVDYPQQVELTGGEDSLSLAVAEPDLGKIIGRQGRTIKAMRVLVNAVAGRQGKTINLDVVE